MSGSGARSNQLFREALSVASVDIDNALNEHAQLGGPVS